MTLQERKNRRRNAKLYPIYKMFSWDLLFYYSIEFLFLTITKGLSASEVLTIGGLYIAFKVIMNIPAIVICDAMQKRKSIIIGNILTVISLVILITMPGAISVIISNLVASLGWTMKTISESNLIYDSVATRSGNRLYTKLDSRGGMGYYLVDGMASLIAGYLFVINNYLPMYICLGFLVISTILSLFFKEIYPMKKTEMKSIIKYMKEYKNELKVSMKSIIRSKRMRAYILFGSFFYGIIRIYDTYRGDLLVDIGIPEEQFSMIFAILTFVGAISVSFISILSKKLKNRLLTFISLVCVLSYLIVGILVNCFTGDILVPIILVMYCLAKMSHSIWNILKFKYLKNFTKPEMRNKITFAYEFISGIISSILAVLGGLLLNVISIKVAFLVVGLASLSIIICILDYMKTRIGLKPEEYRKEDIELFEKGVKYDFEY